MRELKLVASGSGRMPAGELASPCVRMCTLDDAAVCIGCGRTLDEITGWSALDDAGKRSVLAAAEGRRTARMRQRPLR